MTARSQAKPDPDPFPIAELLAKTALADRSFFQRGTVELARTLLGCVLVHEAEPGVTAGMIVETEAYLGGDDLAAHSSRGLTPRTRVIFGPPGHAYVYFIYGMHECLNIVAEREGEPGCVLIRALEPLTGLGIMRQRRHWHGRATGITNGPGKLTQALAITRALYGAPLFEGELTIRRWHRKPKFEIATTPRIGIRECEDWPLRYIWAGNRYLSRQLPAGPDSANRRTE